MKLKLILLLCLPITIIAQIPQTSNLVGEYLLYSDANDSSGKNYHGDSFGSPTLTTDRFNNTDAAYTLDGSDDYFHFDDDMLNEWTPNENGWIVSSFTISFWSKSTQSLEHPIVAFGVHNNGNLYSSNSLYKGMITRMGTAIKMNSNNWPTYSNNSGFSTSGRSHDGQWHHYVLVWNYDTGYRQAYIDGSLVGQFQQVESGTIRKRFAIRDKGLSIGRERYENDGSSDDPTWTNGSYDGSVDDIRIWNLALTSSEISNLYTYDNTSSNYGNDWTNGSSDGNWSTTSNWSEGALPTKRTSVIVEIGETLTVDINSAVCGRLIIKSGGTLIISAGSKLTVSGPVVNTGTLTNSGDIVLTY